MGDDARSHPERTSAFGQHREATPVDRFGVWLSSRAVRRHTSFDGACVGDFGCGYEATFVRSVLDRVDHAVLVDVALAADLKVHRKTTAHEGSIIEVLPELPAASLDVTLCLSVLEHLWEPASTLSELRRVTKPGGTVLVNVPSWAGKRALELSAFKLGLSPAEEMDDHKRYYDPKDLWPLLVQAGFRPSDITCRRHKAGLNTYAACRVAATGRGENP